jgi:hypothetical protein
MIAGFNCRLTGSAEVEQFKIPAAWREKQITLDEAEDKIVRHIERSSNPFPGMSATDIEDLEKWRAKANQSIMDQWERMKRQLDPQVSLWTFSSPLEVWTQRAGMSGIALFQDAEVLSHVALVCD